MLGVGAVSAFINNTAAVANLPAGHARARADPARRTGEDLTQNFRMDEYLTDIVLLPESRSVGTPLGGSPPVRELNITVLEIFRDLIRRGPNIFFR